MQLHFRIVRVKPQKPNIVTEYVWYYENPYPRRWHSRLIRPARGRLGVRIPAPTDISRKNRK